MYGWMLELCIDDMFELCIVEMVELFDICMQ
jgi:hypothetical protein